MGGITLEDFTQSAAYREIYGLGEERGREQGLEQGRQAGELDMVLLLLRRRCGALTPEQEARVRLLPLARLEALAEALLDFQGPDVLNAWLAQA
jgi:predicted transposase YdaD